MDKHLLKNLLKKWAKEIGIDLIGVASSEVYKNVPAQFNPKSILPGVKSIIAFAVEIPRGMYKGVEEGTLWMSIPRQTKPFYAYELCRRFEDMGVLAVPCSPLAKERWPDGVLFNNAIVEPNVTPSLEYAATVAGLGEVGYHGMFLTPEFGVRQKLGMVFTEAEIEPDRIFNGKICERETCAECVAACPIGAMEGTVTCDYGAGEVTISNIDYRKCKLCANGAFPDTSYEQAPPNRMNAACVRACLVCLEEKKLTQQNKYRKPFRTKEPWGVGLYE